MILYQILSVNFVTNKHITIDDKNPVWMNETIKSKMKAKHILYKKYIENGRLFAEQCTPLKNDSVLPINQMFLTQSRLGILDFN